MEKAQGSAAGRRRLLLLGWLVVVVLATLVVVQVRARTDGQAELLLQAQNRDQLAVRRADLWSRGIYDESGYERMGPPQPGEWLAVRPEAGQPYTSFVRRGPLRATPDRPAIVLQPLRPLSAPAQAQLEAIRTYTEAFFGLPTRLAEPLDLPQSAYAAERKQYNAPALLDFLAERKPADALVYAGVADEDFFTPSLANFVFGVGRLKAGIGVYSFERFWRPGLPPGRYVRRSVQLLSHEIGHSFGLLHCIYYRCTMNGSNSLRETDGAPPHLCPVCLRKLQHSLGFDVVERYRRLAPWYAANDLPGEAAWIQARIAQLAQQDPPVPWKDEPDG